MSVAKMLVFRGYPRSGITDMTCDVLSYLGTSVIQAGLAFTETASGSSIYTATLTAVVSDVLSTYSVNIFRGSGEIAGGVPVDLQELAGAYILGGPDTGLEMAAQILLASAESNAVIVAPSTPPEVTGYLTCLDQFGNALAGVTHTLVQIASPSGRGVSGSGFSFSTIPRTAVSASNGLVQFTGMTEGATYTIQRSSGTPVKFRSVTGSPQQLPDCTD
jgi:hypothetical protein